MLCFGLRNSILKYKKIISSIKTPFDHLGLSKTLTFLHFLDLSYIFQIPLHLNHYCHPDQVLFAITQNIVTLRHHGGGSQEKTSWLLPLKGFCLVSVIIIRPKNDYYSQIFSSKIFLHQLISWGLGASWRLPNKLLHTRFQEIQGRKSEKKMLLT